MFFSVRLSEKKAQIGYTYEDSTVTEPDEETEKGNEEDSENSDSEEDEVIPDIGVSFIYNKHFLLGQCFFYNILIL